MRQAFEAVEAVKKAQQQWEGAPFHVKAMAGSYMDPVLAALDALLRLQMLIIGKMVRQKLIGEDW